jgi:peptidoglycan L-alanyl-D-glutamate endopeptidase CwlK
MDAAGIPFMFTCTYRSQEEQDALYAQGRTKPGPVVTWTRHSKHSERTAFDIAIVRDGKPVWDVKVDVDNDHVPDYLEAAKIGEEVGLLAGARWKKPDYPHFQEA